MCKRLRAIGMSMKDRDGTGGRRSENEERVGRSGIDTGTGERRGIIRGRGKTFSTHSIPKNDGALQLPRVDSHARRPGAIEVHLHVLSADEDRPSAGGGPSERRWRPDHGRTDLQHALL